MNTFFPMKVGCAALALLLGLGSIAGVQAQRLVIDGRRIVVEPSTGGSAILDPGQPAFFPGAHFSIDEEGRIVSAPGYRCSAATAAPDSPIICRSQFNRNDVVVYRRDRQPNTFFVDSGNTVLPPSGSGLRIVPDSGAATPSGSGLRIIFQ